MTNSNGFDKVKLERAFEQIDQADDELASMKGSYMLQCRRPRAQIKDVKAQLRENGCNMRAFAVLLQKHRDERAQARRAEGLEPDDRAELEQMIEALGPFGDTPLGQAAIVAAGGEVLDNLTQ